MNNLSSCAQAHARLGLIKNVRLETVIELFKDDSAGSGQVRVEEAPKLFGIPEKEPHPDIIKLILTKRREEFLQNLRIVYYSMLLQCQRLDTNDQLASPKRTEIDDQW